MEGSIKSEFVSPMITFDVFNGNANSGCFYYSSPAESTISLIDCCSPEQSPPNSLSEHVASSNNLYSPNEQSFFSSELGGANLDLPKPTQYQLQYSQEFTSLPTDQIKFITGLTSTLQQQQQPQPTVNQQQLANQQQREKSSHSDIAASKRLDELSKLFSMAENTEDKSSVQAKIKQILFEHLSTKQENESQLMSQALPITSPLSQNGSALITPPLSPNGMFVEHSNHTKHSLFSINKNVNPLVPQAPCPIMSESRPVVTMPGHLIKVEATNATSTMQINPVIATSAHPNFPINHQSPSSYIEIPKTNMVVSSNCDITLGTQDSHAANSVPSEQKVYFESADSSEQILSHQSSPVYSYKVNSGLFPAVEIMQINDNNDDVNKKCVELKLKSASKRKANKSAKQSKSKRKLNEEVKTPIEGSSFVNPKQSQKRSAHLSAEFRYRTKLNDKIGKLRTLVGQKVHLSKSAVLTKSIERIIKLQKFTIRLHESNVRLQNLVSKLSNQQHLQQQQTSLIQNNAFPTYSNGSSSSNKLMSIKELTNSLTSTASSATTSGNMTASVHGIQVNDHSFALGQIDMVDIDKFIDSAEEDDDGEIEAEEEIENDAPELDKTGETAYESLDSEPCDTFDFEHLLDQL